MVPPPAQNLLAQNVEIQVEHILDKADSKIKWVKQQMAQNNFGSRQIRLVFNESILDGAFKKARAELAKSNYTLVRLKNFDELLLTW